MNKQYFFNSNVSVKVNEYMKKIDSNVHIELILWLWKILEKTAKCRKKN